METARDIKTLLRLLLAKGEELSISKKGTNFASMCYWGTELWQADVISFHDNIRLKAFIMRNRPIKGKYFDRGFSDTNYYWSPFNFDIRLRWIKYQLRRKLS